MALNDNATVVIGSGNYFTAPVGTPRPTDLLNVGTPWENVGHTSLEDIFGVTSEGGEATTLGTLQNKTLRTRYSARTEKMTFTLQQFDAAGLRLYYGANAPTLENGDIGIPTDPQPTLAAFLCVFVDGDNVFAFYAPKAELYRNDDLSIADTESLAGLPLGVTPVAVDGNKYTYAVTPLTSTALASSASAGTPGVFLPSTNRIPASLAELQGSTITASPATAWTATQYVVLGDESEAFWDGDTWELFTAV